MLAQLIAQGIGVNKVSKQIHLPASNTAAIITLAAPTNGSRWVVLSLQWSYNDDPTGGNLLITDNVTDVIDIDITTGGPGGYGFLIPGSVNEALVITLAAGGSGITGKLSAQVMQVNQ